MPKSVNKVILVGNVGKDPEVRYSQSGTAVANFSLATNERFKDRNDEWQDRTEWHNILAWQRLAEIVGEYVAKRLQGVRRVTNCGPERRRWRRLLANSSSDSGRECISSVFPRGLFQPRSRMRSTISVGLDPLSAKSPPCSGI
jgi:hypothetical protein